VSAASQPPAAPPPAPPPPAAAPAEPDATEDLDPTKLVFFNLRLQHTELGDGNTLDLAVLRRDVAIPRPKRPGTRLALLRFDVPAGQARLRGETFDGLGDLYLQVLNARTVSSRLTLATGLALQLPTAGEDVLGTGKWLVAPTVIPVWRVPGRGLFYTKFQDYVSVAGDDDRRDVNYLTVNPVYLKFIGRRFVQFDTEMIASWERDGEMSWKSGVLVGSALRHRRALWLKLEVPWGEHRSADWTLRASLAFRGRR
jgi:hypothetical protein